MKRFITTLAAILAVLSVSAQKFVDATELGIHGHTKQTDKSPV